MKQRLIYMCMVALALVSCAKTKVENMIPPLSTVTNTNSSIRLFNFTATNLDISVNNYPLTSFVNNSITGGTQIGLGLFPKGYWPTDPSGSPFYIPSSLLDKNGMAHIHIAGRTAIGLPNVPQIEIDTTIEDNALNPDDYYVMDNDNHLFTYSRLIAPPAQQQNVRIRIINLGQSNDPLRLSGPVTLTYADGTPVSALTSGVAAGATSSYAEIPFGSYQLKLFMSGGSAGIDVTRQLTEEPMYPNYDPCGTDPVQEGLFPVNRTYKPGGVYSIVITPNLYGYWACNSQHETEMSVFLNSYRVVTELDPGTNVTFARMQGANALSADPVSFQVDGQPLGDPLGFGKNTDYSIYVQGTHQVSITDGSGKVIVQKSITLYPYDNYCLWAYTDAGGNPDIAFASVDMTGSIYASYYSNPQTGSTVDDGTSGALRVTQVPYPWETRFLNLAPDLPYATFTNDSTLFGTYLFDNDSTAFASAHMNLSPGYLPPLNPYVLFCMLIYPPNSDPPSFTGYQIPPYKIRAYASSPGPIVEIPGTLLTNVAPALYTQYIANPALYTTPLPYAEPGVYTTALIGKIGAAPGDPLAARFIVIKHNK